jgi:hypothetical protein
MKEQKMIQNKYLVFANKGAIENNPILAFIYTIAFPLALLAKKIHLKPNVVTLYSSMFALLAFLALAFDELSIFVIFWLIAYILDFVDGPLARMTGQIESSALDLDHISDILKIILMFLGFGLYFDDYIMWTLSFSSSALYVFYTLINHELDWVQKFFSFSEGSEKRFRLSENDIKSADARSSIKNRLKKYFQNKPVQKKIVQILLNTLTKIHAHTLLIFFFIPLDLYWAYGLMTYFTTIIIYQTFVNVMQLKNMKRVVFVERGLT